MSSATGATGRLVRDPIRRQHETTDFFRKVPMSGGFALSPTFADIVRVRLMHSQVRYSLKRRWGAATFSSHGNPISNSDMAFGVGMFGVLPMLYDEVFGGRYDLM